MQKNENRNMDGIYSMEDAYMNDPLDVCRFMTGKKIRIREKPFEVVYLICLDQDNRFKGCFELGRGTQTCVSASTFDAVRAAALCGSCRVILVHSHPDCGPEPSFSDWKFTFVFARAFRCCGITLVDHVIIGDRGCSSMTRLLHPRLRFLKFREI